MTTKTNAKITVLWLFLTSFEVSSAHALINGKPLEGHPVTAATSAEYHLPAPSVVTSTAEPETVKFINSEYQSAGGSK